MLAGEPLELLNELDRLKRLRQPQPDGQRRFRRFPIRADAELHPLDPACPDRAPLEVKLRDISLAGVGFVCQQAVPINSHWRLCLFRRGYAVGSLALLVRHCKQVSSNLYLAGGQFCIEPGLLTLLDVPPSALSEEGKATADPSNFVSPRDVQ